MCKRVSKFQFLDFWYNWVRFSFILSRNEFFEYSNTGCLTTNNSIAPFWNFVASYVTGMNKNDIIYLAASLVKTIKHKVYVLTSRGKLPPFWGCDTWNKQQKGAPSLHRDPIRWGVRVRNAINEAIWYPSGKPSCLFVEEPIPLWNCLEWKNLV